MLATALFAARPIVDADTGRALAGAQLEYPLAYLAISPAGDVMDALSLLSVSQTKALVLSLVGIYALVRVARAFHQRMRYESEVAVSTRALRVRRRVLRELALALLALIALVATYAVMTLAPRPMAALRVADPATVVADLHSHTRASHDTRGTITAERNRAWHRAAGFDVAYITDHSRYEEARAGLAGNPPRAGDGTVLLPGLEAVLWNVHVNALGVTPRTAAWLGRGGAITGAVPAAVGAQPLYVMTIPEGLDAVPPPDSSGRNGVVAIEIADAAPRGIEQGQRDRALLFRLADSLDLAVVAGSNNHGWGRTAAAWNLVRIPGWRALSPGALGEQLTTVIRTQRRQAVRVVARRSPVATSRAALALTLPAVAWTVLTGLSPAQRVAWLAWSWLPVLAAIAARRVRTRARGAAAPATPPVSAPLDAYPSLPVARPPAPATPAGATPAAPPSRSRPASP